MYKTNDQGAHWQVNNGWCRKGMRKTSRALGVTPVQVDPFAPDTVYAATLSACIKPRISAASRVRIGESLGIQMIVAMVLIMRRPA